jgi:hypothetical protein
MVILEIKLQSELKEEEKKGKKPSYAHFPREEKTALGDDRHTEQWNRVHMAEVTQANSGVLIAGHRVTVRTRRHTPTGRKPQPCVCGQLHRQTKHLCTPSPRTEKGDNK